MSQEKVDAYKKEKANRRKALEKKKKKAVLYRIIGAVAGILVLAWIVCSIGWTYAGWPNPFAEKETSSVYTEAEISSIREKLGLDANGNTTTVSATTASDNKADDSTTANNNDDSTKEETTAAK